MPSLPSSVISSSLPPPLHALCVKWDLFGWRKHALRTNISAPFQCSERVILFNKWKSTSLSLRWNRRSLLQMITYSSHFLSGHNSDFLVLKQWKSAWNRIMPSLRCLPWNQWPRAACLFIYFKKAQELRHYPFHHLQISYYTPCLPPKFCITSVFDFSSVIQWSLEKWKTMLLQSFGEQTWFILGDVYTSRILHCVIYVLFKFLSKTCNYLHPFLALFCTHT